VAESSIRDEAVFRTVGCQEARMTKLIRFAMVPALVFMLGIGAVAKSNDQDKSKEPDLKPKKDVEQIGDRDVDGSVNFYSLEKEIGL
jgi:hypothetical protein